MKYSTTKYMGIADVKKWMEQNGLTVQDIAYALKIHPQTVYRYLQGKSVNRSTKASIERLVTNNAPIIRG